MTDRTRLRLTLCGRHLGSYSYRQVMASEPGAVYHGFKPEVPHTLIPGDLSVELETGIITVSDAKGNVLMRTNLLTLSRLLA